MASQSKLDRAYLRSAQVMAEELSHATRRKVGALLVSPKGGIIAEGINGTPSGFDNCPEEVVTGTTYDDTELCPMGNLVTKPECLHAESNAIAKVAKSTNSSEGATMYVTLSPCYDCAKLIIQAGITRVVYFEKYRKTEGLDLLEKAGIPTEHFNL